MRGREGSNVALKQQEPQQLQQEPEGRELEMVQSTVSVVVGKPKSALVQI